ncbi:MAG: signal peptidase I [Alphaproteobacteria bacterium]
MSTDQQQKPEAAAPSGTQKAAHKESWLELVKTIAYALLIAVVFRTFLFQPFNIPSGSMEDTLLVGDYLFVSKTAYGYSRHSFAFSFPPFSGRFLGSEPERGDIVVFKLPSDNSTDYIKRVIGLPGDRVQVIEGVVHINGVPAKRETISEGAEFLDGMERHVVRYRETLPNGKTYETLSSSPGNHLNNTGVFVVPEGHYFMMGDNRDNSADSRSPTSGVGYVPMENLVGKAEVIFFSTDGSARIWEIWQWPFAIRYSRVGTFLG